MTEEQAKTKWCPMKKFEHFKPLTFTGTPEECDWHFARVKEAQDKRAQDMNCIGSACMMWRWDAVSHTSYMGTRDKLEGDKLYPVRPDDGDWRACTDAKPAHAGWTNWKKEHLPRDGYCGLSGKS